MPLNSQDEILILFIFGLSLIIMLSIFMDMLKFFVATFGYYWDILGLFGRFCGIMGVSKMFTGGISLVSLGFIVILAWFTGIRNSV